MGSFKAINVKLTIATDIDKWIDIGNENLSKHNDLQKQAELQAKIASNAFKQASELSDKAIKSAQELGVSTDFFKGRKSMAQDGISRSNKGKSNII